MINYTLKRGSTSNRIQIFIQSSAGAAGLALTGLAHNTASLVAYYLRDGDAAAVAITLVDGTVGTWLSSSFKEVSAANMPGLYELSLPNAAVASGNKVTIILKGAADMVPCVIEIALHAVDLQDTVRAGLTSLPNAAAEAVGGLPTVDASNAVKVQSGTSANQINLSSGKVLIQNGAITTATLATDLPNPALFANR